MDEMTRVKKDIDLFEKNLEILSKKKFDYNDEVVELASQYFFDSKYYFDKNDFFTTFGCINYAHGLLDAILKF
jgi:hypothetical protein